MSNAFLKKHQVIPFHNATDADVRTVIGDIAVVVPPGGNLELPRALAWVVKARGLRLTEGASPSPDAPMATTQRHRPKQPPRPRSVELGEIKKRAQEDGEDEMGDGPELAGDDDGDDDDPIEGATKKLEAAGVDTASLPGARRARTGARGVQ